MGYRIAGSFAAPINVEDFYPLYSWEGLERNRRDTLEKKLDDGDQEAPWLRDEEEEDLEEDHSRWDVYVILAIISRR